MRKIGGLFNRVSGKFRSVASWRRSAYQPLVIALVALVAGSCSDPAPDLPDIAISPTDVTVFIDGTQQFSARNADGAVTWASSDPTIASVVSTGFATGHRRGAVQIRATDSRGTSSATLSVRTRAALTLSANALTFSQQKGAADSPAQVVQITDGGDDKVGAVAIGAVAYEPGQPTGWLTATPVGSAAPVQLTLRASAGTLPIGTYNAVVPVSALGASNGTQNVTVTFTVVAAPAIQLSLTNLAFSGLRGIGTVPAQSVLISNSGGGTLTQITTSVVYQAGQTPGWLTATLNTANAPATLSVQPTIGTLPDGTYNATIVAAAVGASNSPQSIAVTLTVTSNSIVLSATSVPFTASVGGASPAQQTVNISNGGSGTLSGLAVAVTYGAGQTPGWLTTATLATANAPTTLTLRPTVGSLPAGTYTASVTVTSAVAVNSPQTIAVSLVVSNLPSIVLSATTVSFASSGGPPPAAKTVDITNGGANTLSGLVVAVTYQAGQTPGWLTTATLNTTTAPSTLTLQPTVGSLNPGTYTATVSISAAGASNSPQTVTVTFNVSTNPTIALSKQTAAFTASVGGANPSAQTVDITNVGTGTLTGLAATVSYQTGQPTGWLGAPQFTATTGPATLTLQPVVGTLPVGTYTATVSVTSAVASNSPQTITVTLVVSASPSIVLSDAYINFDGQAGLASPSAKTVTITNGNAGTLSGLTTTVNYSLNQPTGWLAASLSTTTATSTLTLTPTTGSLPAGTYTATVLVASAIALNTPQFVTVTFVVASPPSIALSATTRTFSTNFGAATAPVAQTITITNAGTLPLTGLNTSIAYTAGQPTGWLTATLSTTTATSTLTIRPNVLAQGGVFTATISVASPVANNSPRVITVTYTVMVSFATDIYPQISMSCVSCHASGTSNLNGVANAYNNLVNYITTGRVGYPAATTSPTRVAPGNASNSYMYLQVTKAAGAYGMPLTTNAPAAWIDRLREWINLGAPNN